MSFISDDWAVDTMSPVKKQFTCKWMLQNGLNDTEQESQHDLNHNTIHQLSLHTCTWPVTWQQQLAEAKQWHSEIDPGEIWPEPWVREWKCSTLDIMKYLVKSFKLLNPLSRIYVYFWTRKNETFSSCFGSKNIFYWII